VPICGTVSQISPPIRVLLVGAVLFMAAWMLFLRPKAETAPAPATPAPAPNTQTGEPAVSAPGKVAEAAKQAVDATNKKTQESTGGTGAAAAPPTTATGTGTASAAPSKAPAAAGDVEAGELPVSVLKAIADHKVMVLLFWNRESADDRAVRRELRGVDEWDGEVVVKAAPIKQVSRFGRITRGADVNQSPTVVVVDRKLKAEALVGYVDRQTIDQAVVDAMRNSGVVIKDRYLRAVNEICASTVGLSFSVADPNNAAQVPGFLSTQRRLARRMNTRFTALKAPARHRGFKRATARDHAALVAILGEWSAALGRNPSTGRVLSTVPRFNARLERVAKRYDRRMDSNHVLSCGSNA
jgi:hypothetical protein